MLSRISKLVLLGVAAVHLTLVTLSASYIKIAEGIPGKTLIDFYRKASGSDSSYGFFAPSISAKVRGTFDIVDHDGKKITGLSLSSDAEREVQIRAGGIFDEFTSEDADNFRKPLAASLAAAMFSQHKKAAEVVLHVQQFRLKSMDEYRAGERANWSEYYVARFARNQD